MALMFEKERPQGPAHPDFGLMSGSMRPFLASHFRSERFRFTPLRSPSPTAQIKIRALYMCKHWWREKLRARHSWRGRHGSDSPSNHHETTNRPGRAQRRQEEAGKGKSFSRNRSGVERAGNGSRPGPGPPESTLFAFWGGGPRRASKGKPEPEKRRSAGSLRWRLSGAERRFGALHLNSIASLPFKDFARIGDQHGLQLFVGHAFLLQCRNHIVMDM